ncbi:helix-turn-helix domain-containing protein [Gracilibacillus salinarum]|uniref:helix-turn-helix domain-containing protein n=1 Tax=Gracilibacillus salinarum TaxID=2932255 RepID=UPI0034E197EE
MFKSQSSLILTDHTILTIALSHGFQNVSAYNQLFKKIYRKTPTEFRRIHRH